MIHYNYSPHQLEEKALELLKQFDSERLTKTKPLDVYAVIEKCLDVPYDWKYLTPNQSILGMTAFKAGTLWVWPESYYEEGMLPTKIYVKEGTILIDGSLTELPERGAENFTVMHEVFHQVLHTRCFRHSNPDYTHCTTRDALKNGKRQSMTPLEICEYQANTCAAAFLMPKPLLIEKVNRYAGGRLHLKSYADYLLVKNLAEEFSVSPTAMKFRLLNLGLADQ
ncbi:MAG: ImmA/IrrE family metallo-endopeptidase [Parasporobacterium sp.]|nr:ImmA/IrrE family metallo-endopeptidase [Parasporobacterium sp.]